MSTKNAEDVTNPCTSFNGLNEWDKYIWLLICTINWICMFMETQIANWNNDFLIFKVHYRWHQSFLNMSDGLMSISVQLKDEDFSAYQGWIVLYCAICTNIAVITFWTVLSNCYVASDSFDSPPLSVLSLKSDRSMQMPIHFRNKTSSTSKVHFLSLIN